MNDMNNIILTPVYFVFIPSFLLILVKLSKLGEHLFSDRYLSRYSTKPQGDQPATVPGIEGT